MRMNWNRVKRMAAVTAAALAAAAVVTVPVVMAGCAKKAQVEAETQSESKPGETAAPEPEDIRTATQTAVGDSDRMVESGDSLYFKYGSSIWRLDPATGEQKTILTFGEDEQNQSFWVYGGNLYFDRIGGASSIYGLYKMDLETGEELHLADLTVAPERIYASDGKLYVRGSGENIVYSLSGEGKTAGELAPSETVYGLIPQDCRELFSGMLPYYAEHCGYLPVQNQTCLVIADTDGTNVREVKEVTNTSSVLFAKDSFFALFRDGSGGTECWQYDAGTLERELLFQSSGNPQLLQYRDGYLYYTDEAGEQLDSDDDSLNISRRFFRAASSGRQLVAELRVEPGMTSVYDEYGRFYAAEDGVYCEKIDDYGLYLAKWENGEGRILEPVLYQSPLRELGTVEAVSELVPCACGETTAAELYIERLVFAGEGEAIQAMNEATKAEQERLLSYGRSQLSQTDESWIHSVNARVSTLNSVIGEITYLSDRYLCVENDIYEYSGGAHGMPARTYFVFDRETGARLGLEDLVENSQEELQELVGEAFRRLAEETNFSFESPDALKQAVSDDVSYQSPFYLTEEGIVFYYGPYEIAAYSEGFPEVTIPYESLRLKVDL